MADKYQLKQIPPTKIAFSAQNPRGESPEQIREDKTFEQLKDSVAQFGVLVPVVVHELRHGDREYVLVDGERRLRAALATNTVRIPAHIASSEDRMGELIQAFHIHMLRKQWKPVAIARAFKRIKKELKRQASFKSDKDLLNELQARTGCTNKQIEDLERAVKYPKKVLDDVSGGKISWSHLVQFEASFVEQLNQHYPKLLQKLGKEKMREVLVEKAKRKVIETTRDLIDNVLPIVQRAKTADEKKLAERLFERFINDTDLSPEAIKLYYDKKFPPPKDQLELANTIIDNSELLNSAISQIDASLVISFPKSAKALKKSMEDLKRTMSKKLRQLDRVMN